MAYQFKETAEEVAEAIASHLSTGESDEEQRYSVDISRKYWGRKEVITIRDTHGNSIGGEKVAKIERIVASICPSKEGNVFIHVYCPEVMEEEELRDIVHGPRTITPSLAAKMRNITPLL